MDRKIIFDRTWDFMLMQDEAGNYFFEVVCGTVGIYTIEFKLNKQEIDQWEKEGEIFLQHLSYKVRDNHDVYYKRGQEK